MSNSGRPPFRILVVDDEQSMLDLYRRTLDGPEQVGDALRFHVTLCTQGKEAVEAVRRAREEEDPYAMAFIDISLGAGPDGVWTAENIQELDGIMELVLVTGHEGHDLEEILRRIPLPHKLLYLTKPFHPYEIWQLASSLCAKWRMEQDLETIRRSLEVMVEERTKELVKATARLRKEIEQRKGIEAALRESEKRYRSILRGIEDGYYEVDLEGNFTLVNRAICETSGYSENELIGSNYRICTTSRGAKEAYDVFHRVFASGRPVRSYTWEMITKRGLRKSAELSITLIKDMNGKGKGFRGIIRDVTEAKEKEKLVHDTLRKLRKAMRETIRAIALIVETRDPYTAGHQRRVADLARAIGKEMGLERDRIECIRMAGVIHDLGKISVPSEILSKPAKLNDIEFSLVKTHCRVGYEILAELEFPWPIADVILQHHERMDGSGYPGGLKGEEIRLEARILAVADVVEAMASHRPYRPALGLDKAMEEISANAGKLFDPPVAEACLRLIKDGGFKLK